MGGFIRRLAGILPLIPHLICLQNQMIRREVGQDGQKISQDWTIRFWLAGIFFDEIRILC